MKSKMRTWNVAMGSLSLLFLCVSPALAIATNPSQENPSTERNDDSVTQQRTRKVTGVVLDTNGESIIGANVVVKGTNNGTITDLDGKFSIELSDGETLQVSFIGYNSKDVMVGAGENHIKVQLREDTQKLLSFWSERRHKDIGRSGSSRVRNTDQAGGNRLRAIHQVGRDGGYARSPDLAKDARQVRRCPNQSSIR